MSYCSLVGARLYAAALPAPRRLQRAKPMPHAACGKQHFEEFFSPSAKCLHLYMQHFSFFLLAPYIARRGEASRREGSLPEPPASPASADCSREPKI